MSDIAGDKVRQTRMTLLQLLDNPVRQFQAKQDWLSESAKTISNSPIYIPLVAIKNSNN